MMHEFLVFSNVFFRPFWWVKVRLSRELFTSLWRASKSNLAPRCRGTPCLASCQAPGGFVLTLVFFIWELYFRIREPVRAAQTVSPSASFIHDSPKLQSFDPAVLAPLNSFVEKSHSRSLLIVMVAKSECLSRYSSCKMALKAKVLLFFS